MRLLLAFAAGLAASCLAHAQDEIGTNATTGFRFAANTAIFAASAQPRALGKLPVTDASSSIVSEARLAMKCGSTRAVVLAHKEQIVFEDYSFGVSADSTPFAYSISKSLVALAVGKALCEGAIHSLDDKAAVYAPALAGTSYGEASVRDLLMMRSGAYEGDLQTGHPEPGESFVLQSMYQGSGLRADLLERMKKFTGAALPGTRFSYKNYDTQALTFVVEGATKTDFSGYFDRSIWQQVRPARKGAWLRATNGMTVGFAGFSAAPHDYVRIGFYLVDEMRKTDSCFARYLAAATGALAKDTPSAGRSYGYQIHKLSLLQAPENFWFLGYGGQVLAVNPKAEQVAYLYQMNWKQTVPWIQVFLKMNRELQ